MYILKLAIQKLRSRPGSTFFSVLLFAIGCSIISLIIIAEKNLQQSVERNFSGIDLVVGAKGSPLQLILSSVLHADYPTGNIPLAQAEQITRNPLVKKAIPLALGDNYRGFRIVGAPVDYPLLYDAQLTEGSWHNQVLDAVVGANIQRSTGLQLGDQFYGVHGFRETGHAHPEFLYTVTGIMERSGGIMDNLIITPVESVWKVHGDHYHDDHQHDDHKHDHHPHNNDLDHAHLHNNDPQNPNEDPQLLEIKEKIEAGEDISFEEMQLYQEFLLQSETPSVHADLEITAMLLQFRSPAGMIQLTRTINESTRLQAASPALEINRLMSLTSTGFDLLSVLAWIIIIISGVNIFIHLWNVLRQEMQDIALMRVMGAGRATVFMLLLWQGIILAAAGWLAGTILARLVWLLLPSFHFMTDTSLMMLFAGEATLLIFALITGIIASLIPAWNAYNTDVHYSLTRKQ